MPPACRASSKSSSVRETLRPARPLTSREATGWSPVGNDEGGTGDRGDCCLKMCARMEDGAGTGTVGELASEDDPGGGTEVGARLSRRPRQGVSLVRGQRSGAARAGFDQDLINPLPHCSLSPATHAHGSPPPLFCIHFRPALFPFLPGTLPSGSHTRITQNALLVSLIRTGCWTIIYNIYGHIVQREPS